MVTVGLAKVERVGAFPRRIGASARNCAGEGGAGMVAASSNDRIVAVGKRVVADGALHASDAGGESDEPETRAKAPTAARNIARA
jgi:hypothetical protein